MAFEIEMPPSPRNRNNKKWIKKWILFPLLFTATAALYSIRIAGYVDRHTHTHPHTSTFAPPPITTTAKQKSLLPNHFANRPSKKGDDDNKFASEYYNPASSERYILENAVNLGYDTNSTAKTCTVWKNETATTPAVYRDLHAFRKELVDYNQRRKDFLPVSDIRLRMDSKEDQEAVCQSLELHQDGLPGIFPSGQLSLSTSGYIEPLLPPLRHPDFCFVNAKNPRSKEFQSSLMKLTYLVHDFGAMCRQLKRHSKIVLVDMGASLNFHKKDPIMPAVYLTELYRKFGFPFDHVYAFEVTPTPPAEVYEKLPAHLMAAYHWINVGVSADPTSLLNPLKLILENFHEDDLIVIKLDIDTSSIEVPLAMQLLQDDRYSKLIDHFYFEHHVGNAELAASWKKSMKGSVKESLDLFAGLRKKGIAAHSWV